MRLPERERSKTVEVKIVDFKQTMVAVLEHRGSPTRLNESVREFIDWRKESGLSPVASSRTFGLVYRDPETTPPDEFRFDICGEVTAAVAENPQGVTTKQIPAGRCATVRHYGSTDRIGESAYYLYREWLPQSGEELRDFPLFFHYLKLMPETPEHELVTDVYLPLK
jgi:AraC family transcriptional regulator